MKKTKPLDKPNSPPGNPAFQTLSSGICDLIKEARRQAARSINAFLTATHWEIGRRIVEFEQRGKIWADYGKGLLSGLSRELTREMGKGFSVDNLELMRLFYVKYPPEKISKTLSRKGIMGPPNDISNSESLVRNFTLNELAHVFPLSWTHYFHLIRRCKDDSTREFYEGASLRCGWSVRELDRQINSKFYERTIMSRNRTSILEHVSMDKHIEVVSCEEEIKDPFILEFLDLKDEYSESDFEEALIHHLERFLLELGNDFCFLARQKKLRIGNEWYRVDLLFYHRVLRCLILIDLKIGKFTYADAGQMHMYLNYAKEQWLHDNENPPVGIILCAEKDYAMARYALQGLSNNILAREYKLTLPAEGLLMDELQKTQEILEFRKKLSGTAGRP